VIVKTIQKFKNYKIIKIFNVVFMCVIKFNSYVLVQLRIVKCIRKRECGYNYVSVDVV